MQDMRFSAPVPPVHKEAAEGQSKRKLGTKMVGLFFAIIVLGAIFYFLYLKIAEKEERLSVGPTSPYYAVFLSNEQVYFGKLKTFSKEEMVLTQVYYLQLSGGDTQAELTEPRFSLVKLGQELHGPEDEMFINREHVLFYEKLRDDSQVVQSIRSGG